MGGYIAQRLALSQPRLVRRLVLASTDPGSPRATQPDQATITVLTNPDLTSTSLLPVLFPANQQAAGQAWMAAIGTQPGLTAADFATQAATMAEQEKATAQRWYGRGRGTYAQLPRLAAPTLIGYGTEDVVVLALAANGTGRRVRGRYGGWPGAPVFVIASACTSPRISRTWRSRSRRAAWLPQHATVRPAAAAMCCRNASLYGPIGAAAAFIARGSVSHQANALAIHRVP
jgi:pimeloyl-ACP methyl ester carboxylesterase